MVVAYAGSDDGVANDQLTAPVYGSRAVVRNGRVLYARQNLDQDTFEYSYAIAERALTGGAETIWYATTNINGYPTLRPQWAATGIVFESQLALNNRDIYWCSAPGHAPRNLSSHSEADCYPVVMGRTVVWQRGSTFTAPAKEVLACDVVTGVAWRVMSAAGGPVRGAWLTTIKIAGWR